MCCDRQQMKNARGKHPSGRSDNQQTYGWRRRARRLFDFRSKTGDMRGGFRAISSEIASLHERTAGRTACRSTSEGVHNLDKVPKALCRYVKRPAGCILRGVALYYSQIHLAHLLAPFPFRRSLIPLDVALLRLVPFPPARMKNSLRILCHFHLRIVLAICRGITPPHPPSAPGPRRSR